MTIMDEIRTGHCPTFMHLLLYCLPPKLLPEARVEDGLETLLGLQVLGGCKCRRLVLI